MMIELMLILGFLSHHLSVLTDLKLVKKKDINWVSWYIKERPFKLMTSIIGMLVGYAVLMEMNQLTVITAFGVGFMSDTVADRLGKITAGRMQ